MRAPAAAAAAALRGLDLVAVGAIVAAMSVMTVVVCAQVVYRYGFNESFDWADELSRLCFVWVVFLAIPIGVKRGAHVALQLLTPFLPRPLRLWLWRAMSLLVVVTLVVVFVQTMRLLQDTWYETMLTMDISTGWMLVPIAVCAAHASIHLLAQLRGGPPAEEPLE